MEQQQQPQGFDGPQSRNDSNIDSKYMPELMAEKDSIDASFVHAARLISEEIEKIKNPRKHKPKTYRNVMKDEVIKIEEDIIVPVKEYPGVNFVGRLIGPGGSTLKGIQEISNTKIAVLGKGSVRPKKGEEIDKSDPKLSHLDLPLHVHISAMGTLANVYYNLSVAITEIQKLLQMDDDTAVQFAVAQGMTLNPFRAAASEARSRGSGHHMGGRGMSRGGGGGGFGHRGGPRGSANGSRPRGAMGAGTGGAGRGSPRGTPMRGGRGRGMPGRGMSSGGRGMQSRPRGGAGGGYTAPKTSVDPYGAGDYGYDQYGSNEYADAFGEATGYDASGYDETSAYEDASYGVDTGSYDYSYEQEMGSFSGTPQKGGFGQKPFRGKAPSRGGGRGRAMSKPY